MQERCVINEFTNYLFTYFFVYHGSWPLVAELISWGRINDMRSVMLQINEYDDDDDDDGFSDERARVTPLITAPAAGYHLWVLFKSCIVRQLM